MAQVNIGAKPDFAAITQAHHRAEVLGFVEPTQRPVGSVCLEAAYADVEADERLIESIATALPDAESEIILAGVARHGLGYDGRSKTTRRSTSKQPTAKEHPIKEAVSNFRDAAKEDLEISSDFTAWFEGQYFDGTEDHDLIVERWQTHLDDEWDRIHDDTARAESRMVADGLRNTGYASGFGVSLSAREVHLAEATLRWDSTHRKGGRSKPPLPQWMLAADMTRSRVYTLHGED